MNREQSRAIVAKWVRPVRAVIASRGGGRTLSVLTTCLRGRRYPTVSNLEHIRAAMDWLCAAQDATGSAGVSAYYDFVRGGWAPAYPETTGYIIPTFFDYAARTGDNRFRDRAIRMANWLLGLQLGNGAFPIGPLWPRWLRTPIVFDTGQIIQGLVRAYQETGNSAYLDAGRRAGDWLVQVQDEDGSWRRYDYRDVVHTYNARVAWALLLLALVACEDKYLVAGLRHLRWCTSQQQIDGWFAGASFLPCEDPLTHTIAYTIRGLLEGGLILGDEELILAARKAADRLNLRQVEDGYLRGTFGSGWRSQVTWSCLTGDVQMAQIWLRLYQLTGDRAYLDAGVTGNSYVKETQVRWTGLAGIDGGIAGSYPIQGEYQPFQIVNWAAKFFVDSLLLEDAILARESLDRHETGINTNLLPLHSVYGSTPNGAKNLRDPNWIDRLSQ